VPGNPIPPGFNNANTYSESLGAGLYSVIVSRDYGACFGTPQFDHTVGDQNGRYLWFDTGVGASTTTPQVAWQPYDPNRPPGLENTIDVQPNTTYVFSCWIRDLAREVDCQSGGAPIMGLRINGADLAQIDLQDYTTPCCPEWIYLCTEWNSGNSSQALIQVESRTDLGYTDLGIDDVFFGSTFANQQGILGNDVEANCTTDSLVLTVPPNSLSVLWNNGSTEDSLVVTQSGTYWVELTQAGCSGRDSINVSFFTGSLNVDLGPDTSTCASPPITLQFQAPVAGSTLWSNGATTNSLSVNEAGTYWVQFTSNCGVARDTVEVSLRPSPSVELGPDVEACQGESVALAAPTNQGTALWSNGSTAYSIEVENSGQFIVTLNNGCVNSDTLQVSFFPLPQLNLPDSLGVCPGESVRINAGGGPFEYLWNTGETDSILVLNQTGIFAVSKMNICGVQTDSVVVFQEEVLEFPSLPDTLLCLDETFEVVLPQIPQGVLWNDGSTEFIRTIERTGVYTVTANQACGVQEATFLVQFKPCFCDVFVPSAFTPDYDGVNDGFLVATECDFTFYELRIFNRWGEQFFFSSNPAQLWDGGKGDYFAPNGMYSYQLKYALEGNEPASIQGTVAVLR
jgi:gliding motility-associated-like protein